MPKLLLLPLVAAAVACGSGAGGGEMVRRDACGRTVDGAAAAAAAVTVPKAGPPLPHLDGRVVDEADLLTPSAEAALSRQLATLEQRTRDQLVVVTVPDLHGEAIEDFGLRLGNSWGIGQRDLDNGILLIVAPNERTTRIEVGCGLEGLVTDAKAAEVIEETLLPRFRRSDYQQGIASGVDELIHVLTSAPKRPTPAANKKAA